MDDFSKHWASLREELEHGTKDGMCLLHHASYLMRSAGALWIVDPLLDDDEHEEADEEMARLLKDTELVLLSHLHSDHFDERFLELMARTKALIVVPDFTPEESIGRLRAAGGNVRTVTDGDTVDTGHLHVSVFRAMHTDTYMGTTYDIPEYGFRVEANGRNWLFPGDIRDYTAAPELDRDIDEMIAHVWLGRKNARHVTDDYIKLYSGYFAASGAKRYWLTHLYDRVRSVDSMWTNEHAERVKQGILAVQPDADVRAPEHGVWFAF